jgi:hypothetical protein
VIDQPVTRRAGSPCPWDLSIGLAQRNAWTCQGRARWPSRREPPSTYCRRLRRTDIFGAKLATQLVSRCHHRVPRSGGSRHGTNRRLTARRVTEVLRGHCRTLAQPTAVIPSRFPGASESRLR